MLSVYCAFTSLNAEGLIFSANFGYFVANHLHIHCHATINPNVLAVHIANSFVNHRKKSGHDNCHVKYISTSVGLS